MTVTPREVLLKARNDLNWLAEHGAHHGLAAIIAERRRQVEMGRTVSHDLAHRDETLLVREAVNRLDDARASHKGPQHAAATAGALLAAEVDRLRARGNA